MLGLLKLPDRQDRDAVMILHMGGTFGDKEGTLNRFRQTYPNLSKDIKNRLVLENDDVSWTVHDLLPICEELDIPLVLDYHHHNINFDADKIREGTFDIMGLYDRIKATWTKKGITQKMHYSEPTPPAITRMQRRKHSPRVQMLPPCDPTMDLMIEAKDKEQAVFELMRTYKLPGFDKFNNVIPYSRTDENKNTSLVTPPLVAEEEIGMGGADGRVYWPPGMEEWLRPPKRGQKRKGEPSVGEENGGVTTPKRRRTAKGSTKAEAALEGGKKDKADLKRKRNKKPTPTSSESEPEDEKPKRSADEARLNSKPRASARTRGKKVNYAEGGDS